jgi:hypothetical protein
MFSFRLRSLSHPSFAISKEGSRVAALIAELRKNPESFSLISQSRLPMGERDPIFALRSKPWGIELLATFGYGLHSLFEIRLPLATTDRKSLPCIGDKLTSASTGYLISFEAPVSELSPKSLILTARVSKFGTDSPPSRIESFEIHLTSQGLWEGRTSLVGVAEPEGLLIYDEQVNLPPAPPSSTSDSEDSDLPLGNSA